MKRILTVLILLAFLAASLSARDIITVDVSGMNDEDALSYMFLYGYEAIMEEACKGCFLAIDEEMNYLGGWRTPQTPDDFAVNIPAQAIAIPQVLPKGLAMTMFSLLGDHETTAAVSGISGAGIYAVCIFLPEEGMVIGDPVYDHGRRLLEDELTRHGLNPSDFYAFMETQGITLDMMVATMYRGDATAREIVVDAMGMMESSRTEDNPVKNLLGPYVGPVISLAILVCIAGIVILVVVLATRKKNRNLLEELGKDSFREEHNNEL